MARSRKKAQEANREKKIYEKKANKQTKQQACALRKISGSNQAFQLGCPGLKVGRLWTSYWSIKLFNKHIKYSRRSPYYHSRKRPASYNQLGETLFELWLKLCI